jgi:hypothetical protein
VIDKLPKLARDTFSGQADVSQMTAAQIKRIRKEVLLIVNG